MAKIEYKEGKTDWPKLPTKTQLLVFIKEAEFETEDNPFYGKPTGKQDSDGEDIIDENETRNVVKVVFECLEDEYQGSRVWFNATASIHEKSKLRPLIEAAAFDHDPTIEELKEFNTDDLVGLKLYIAGSYGPKDTNHKWLRPTDFMRYKGAKGRSPKPEPEPEPEEKAAPAAKQSSREKALAAAARREAKAEKPATKRESTPQPKDDHFKQVNDAKDDWFDPDEIPF